jgi:ABC-type transport system involved in multi-copper enzyme maturation permease subunit
MKINRRWLRWSVVVLIIMLFIFGFGYINSQISFKYEVQDTLSGGQPLDEHQKEIIGYIHSSKIEFISCVILLAAILVVINSEPTLNRRVSYFGK